MNRACELLLLVLFFSAFIQAQESPAASSSPTQASLPESSRSAADSCTPEKPVVQPGEVIEVRLWAAQPSGAEQPAWTATAGHIQGNGSQAIWNLSGAPAGYQTATVRYSDETGPATCSAQIVVEVSSGGRGTNRETGHDLLVKGAGEVAGYGLYSYVLLGAAPDAASRERCLRLIEAVLQQAPAVADMEKYFDKKELNVTYLPVTAASKGPASAEWLLENYDYARARFLLHLLPGDLTGGPYIVSSLQPLGSGTVAGPFLLQDLSRVPPHLVALWTGEFLRQASQEHFWQASFGTTMALRVRTAIGIMAEGLPDVRKGLNEWVSLTR